MTTLTISLPESLSALEALLIEGLNSGEPIPADEAFWANLRAEATKIAEDR